MIAPGMRLHLFRTFVRPTAEYGLGLVQAWINSSPPTETLLPLINLHRDSLRWIAYTTNNAHTCILEKLMNLPDPTVRLIQLHAKFFHHLTHTSSSDHIHSLWTQSPFMTHVQSQLY